MTEDTREPEEAQATTPEQVPLALVSGKPPLVDIPPKDLYIPPDALAVFLEPLRGGRWICCSTSFAART